MREIDQDQVKIVSAVQDPRQGFFSHYVLNVTWCPSPCKKTHCKYPLCLLLMPVEIFLLVIDFPFGYRYR